MPAITFYKHEPIPMEMHKVEDRPAAAPAAYRPASGEDPGQAGFNTFQLHNGDIFLDMLTDSGVNAMSDRQQAAMLQADDAYAGSETFYRMQAKLDGAVRHRATACPPTRAAPARTSWPPALSSPAAASS